MAADGGREASSTCPGPQPSTLEHDGDVGDVDGGGSRRRPGLQLSNILLHGCGLWTGTGHQQSDARQGCKGEDDEKANRLYSHQKKRPGSEHRPLSIT